MTRLHNFGTCACCARSSRRPRSTGATSCAPPAVSGCLRRSSRSWRSRPKAITKRWCSAASIRACRSRSPSIPASRGLTGKYSQFVIAGAAIAVVAEPFKDWHKAFWDNLAASIQLHKIKKVIAINHRDCGAAEIAYGRDRVVPEERETETHRAALAEFRKQVGQRHPDLEVETGLMAINGTIEMFS